MALSQTLSLLLRPLGFQQTASAVDRARNAMTGFAGSIPNANARLTQLQATAQSTAAALDKVAGKRTSGFNVSQLQNSFAGVSNSALSVSTRIERIRDSLKNISSRGIRDLGTALQQVRAPNLAALPNTLSSIGGSAAGAAVAVGLLTTAIVGLSVRAASAQEDASNRIAISMRSVGQFSKQAAADYQEFAASIQQNSRLGDDAVIRQMALIQQLGGLYGQSLREATQAAVDLSVGLGRDLNTTSLLLAKAAQGMTSELSRYGIVVDANIPKSERFAAVLAQVRQKFGGSAAADVNTLSGRLSQLKNALADLGESIGQPLLPGLTRFVAFMSRGFQRIADASANKFAQIPRDADDALDRLEQAFSSRLGRLQAGLQALDFGAVTREARVNVELAIKGGSLEEINRIIADLQARTTLAIEADNTDLARELADLQQVVARTYKLRLAADRAEFDAQLNGLIKDLKNEPLELRVQVLRQPSVVDAIKAVQDFHNTLSAAPDVSSLENASTRTAAAIDQVDEAARKLDPNILVRASQSIATGTQAITTTIVALSENAGSAFEQFGEKVRSVAASTTNAIRNLFGTGEVRVDVDADTTKAEAEAEQLAAKIEARAITATVALQTTGDPFIAAERIRPIVEVDLDDTEARRKADELSKLIPVLEAQIRLRVPQASEEELLAISDKLAKAFEAVKPTSPLAPEQIAALQRIAALYDDLAAKRALVFNVQVKGAEALRDVATAIDTTVQKARQGFSLISADDLGAAQDFTSEMERATAAMQRAIDTGNADIAATSFDAVLKSLQKFRDEVRDLPELLAKVNDAINAFESDFRGRVISLQVEPDFAEFAKQFEAFDVKELDRDIGILIRLERFDDAIFKLNELRQLAEITGDLELQLSVKTHLDALERAKDKVEKDVSSMQRTLDRLNDLAFDELGNGLSAVLGEMDSDVKRVVDRLIAIVVDGLRDIAAKQPDVKQDVQRGPIGSIATPVTAPGAPSIAIEGKGIQQAAAALDGSANALTGSSSNLSTSAGNINSSASNAQAALASSASELTTAALALRGAADALTASASSGGGFPIPGFSGGDNSGPPPEPGIGGQLSIQPPEPSDQTEFDRAALELQKAGASIRVQGGPLPVAPPPPPVRQPVLSLTEFARIPRFQQQPTLAPIVLSRPDTSVQRRDRRFQQPGTVNTFNLKLLESATLVNSARNGNLRRMVSNLQLGSR